jgi:hypothetical protein
MNEIDRLMQMDELGLTKSPEELRKHVIYLQTQGRLLEPKKGEGADLNLEMLGLVPKGRGLTRRKMT